MRDRTKAMLAGIILAVVVIIWISCTTAMFYFYYQKFTFITNKQYPAKAQIEELQWDVWTYTDTLDTLKDTKQARPYLDLNQDIPSLLEAMDTKIEEINNELSTEKRDLDQYKQEAEDNLQPFEGALQSFNQTREDFITKVAQAREQLVAEREAQESELQQTQEQNTLTEAEIRDLVNRIANMEDAQRQDRAKLLTQIEKKHRLLESIRIRKRETAFGSDDVDGEILLVDLGKNYVIIDFGRRHRVRKGMKFKVLGLIKGVRPIEKGYVEIREVGIDVSYGTIVSMVSKENPIQSGDVVADDLFERGEKLTFCLVGHLKRFNRAEFSRFVTEMGDAFSEAVTTDTDYLIVGGGIEGNPADQEQIKLARDLGVKIITENFFMNLVNF